MASNDAGILALIIWIALIGALWALIIASYWSNQDFSIWRCDGDALEMEAAPCTLR